MYSQRQLAFWDVVVEPVRLDPIVDVDQCPEVHIDMEQVNDDVI